MHGTLADSLAQCIDTRPEPPIDLVWKSLKCIRATGLSLGETATLWEEGLLEDYLIRLTAAEQAARESGR